MQEGGAFEGVPNCVDVFCHLYSLGISYRCLTFLSQFINGFSIFPKIQLCTYQNDGDIRSVMGDFREPLLLTLIAEGEGIPSF